MYKDGKKWSGEFWKNVKIIDGVWVETEDKTPDDENVFTGLFTYDTEYHVQVVSTAANGLRTVSEAPHGR